MVSLSSTLSASSMGPSLAQPRSSPLSGPLLVLAMTASFDRRALTVCPQAEAPSPSLGETGGGGSSRRDDVAPVAARSNGTDEGGPVALHRKLVEDLTPIILQPHVRPPGGSTVPTGT